ncbi:TOG array regulator of axonemal microtubules protein 1 isoform X1 [Pseudonaja textilis]|uniref:TOG array regulator of axonemal microtubules 1 n=1 Tax=Pseudonaja textilis TaxID=8673 RepID=A0A670XM82_PSETE|nr:TOG array regulator of axonemal microtubules protein 1 isoform X1 [Pseudonaja textilis]
MAREEEQEGGASGGGGDGGGCREPWETPAASFSAGRVPPQTQPGGTPLRFGLVPSELHARLLDQHDYRGRVGAMEQLKRVLGEAPGAALACLPPPSLLGLLSLLRALLDDSNFKVALGALEGLRLLAVRLGPAAGSRSRLEPLVAAAAKVLGDAKLAIRQEYHQLFLGLMRAAGPQPVLDLLLRPEHLQHRNSRVREVVLAISIAALLTFPSEDFELPKLVAALAPALADSKRRVRHAALEAFAVLASALGPGRTSLIFKAVDVVELQDNCEGVMSAVQARLARKTLPKLTDQWFVEYAVPLPSSANGRGFHLPHGADTDWLLEGNRIQSAHSYSGETAGSFTPFADQGVCPRRVLSAGKGKLPWESERPGNQTCFAKGSEPCLTSNDFLHSPKLRASQGVMASHQPHISGKSNLLGFSHSRGKSGSVDSDLQFLGLSSPWQDKVCTSLNFTNKPQRTFCSPPEHTSPLLGCHTSQGTFILPSYPFSSPRQSPKHTSPPTESLKKSQDHAVNFSNSWPLKSFEGLPKPTHQKKFSSTISGEEAEVKPQDTPPIQLKPAFVRTPASRRGLSGTKPVPPIPRGVSPLPDKTEINSMGQKNGEPEDMWLNERDKKLAIDLSELNINERELDEEEMHSSLRSLRNSAAKKRAKLNGSTSDLESPDSVLKLDLTSESPSCLSSPSTSSYSESGVYSLESVTSPLSTAPQGLRTISDIFSLPGGNSCPTKLSPARNRSSIIMEQNLSAGTRFHEKPTSYVSVSGHHLSCGNGSGDYEDNKQKVLSPASLKGQSKEYQVHCKSTKGFTGPSSSLHHLNSLEYISLSALSEDSVVIVGKGMFESPSSLPTYGQSIIFSMENGDAPSFKPKMESLSGIYGRAVQQQSSAPCLDVENERDMKVALSKSAREKMRQKKREEKEHQQIRDLGKKESNPWELLKISESEKMTTDSRNVAFSPLLKRTSSIKKAQPLILLDSVTGEETPGPQMPFKDRTLSVTHSSEIMEPSDLRPFPKPEFALLEALQYLADNDWEKKIEGLNSIRCLSAYHSDALTAKLHETSLAVVQEVKNLRSVVSRAAVVCLGDLFNYLKKSMDQELDNTVKVLLHKAGESNIFIREDVDKALKAMVNSVTPARALSSLINGGQSHLNTAVRRCTAQHLSDVVEHMGPGRILSGIKDITDKILSAVAKFVQDGSQETRYYGRKMLFTLMTHTDFDKMLEKHVLPKDLPYVKETVSNLRQKGLGEMPIVTPSAKGRRSHTGNMDNSRSNMSREVLSASDREIREIRDISRKLVPRNALESAEYVKFITALLNAKDFRDRINGIKQLLADTENNQDLVVANIVKIFDAFKSRLHDSNSKVNQVALETMHQLIPLLKEKLSPIINMLIPALVDNNLNSKNPGIYAAATNVIQALCQHLDNYLLLQPFCTKAQFLNGKAKQDITEKLAELVVELYPRKPHAVEQKVLVVLWHLLGNMTNSGSLPGAGGNIRAATAKLSKALFAQMGQNLLIHAASQPPHIKRTLEEFLDQTT